MKAAIWNIGFGAVAIAAGASGKFVLPGTETSAPLLVAGVLVAAFGVSQLLRARRR